MDHENQSRLQRMLRLLESMLGAGMRKKLFLKMNPRLLALGLEALSDAFLLELLERPNKFSAEMIAAAAKKILFEPIRLNLKAHR